MKQDFLMLAHNYNPKKHRIAGYYVSEKLDGMRCIWDGGRTRGIPKSKVPWANTAKDGRLKSPPVATGLWTRYGGVIHAPDWWLDSLPLDLFLDGELYSMLLRRQELMSIIKQHHPDRRWEKVKFFVFDSPHPEILFDTREVNNTQFHKRIDFNECVNYIPEDYLLDPKGPFQNRNTLIPKHLQDNVRATWHDQEKLSDNENEARERVEELLNEVSDDGGEGLILRDPLSRYETNRSHNLLKVKRLDDDEGIVVGYTTGRKTDKGSKLLGKVGALILDYNGLRLELSGLTDEERELSDPAWAAQNPGLECPEHIEAPHFPRGTKVTFRYRGKSKDGIPQEARYYRKR